MKKYIASSILTASIAFSHAQAQPIDIIGGSAGAQTMHHCGYLPARNADYTHSPVTIRIIQQKLQRLGYYRARIDGQFGPATRRAVGDFQYDEQLPETGNVDGATAARIAYASHPSENVHRCTSVASNYFR